MSPQQAEALTQFFIELDALKQVERRSYIQGGERRENSAEHSWHLAMACWVLAEQLNEPVDMARLLKLALVHDLGEIDAGDTFLYSAARLDASGPERDCVQRLNRHPGNAIADLVELWDDQELSKSREARLLKVVDRLLPFMLNIQTQGRAWRENGVVRSQVARAHAFIAGEVPALHQWISERLDEAIAQGWLADD